jgi:predicted N-acetyltransferase YhbS
MRIRPFEPDDVPAAAAVAMAALDPYVPADTPGREQRVRSRTAYLRESDPGGAWVAEEDGRVVGQALAILRDGVWGLSVLAVHPDVHARGIGRRLIEAALTHGGGGRGGLIVSSVDPKATRLYATSGFDLRPTVSLAGIPDRGAIPAGLRTRPTDDLEAAGALGAAVRGAAYPPEDVAAMGGRVLAVEGRGFAVLQEAGPSLLCAVDEETASDLLWSSLAEGPPGGTVEVLFLTTGQDWAIRTGLAAGLLLSPEGPVFTRGELGPLRPWIPSGAFL